MAGPVGKRPLGGTPVGAGNHTYYETLTFVAKAVLQPTKNVIKTILAYVTASLTTGSLHMLFQPGLYIQKEVFKNLNQNAAPLIQPSKQIFKTILTYIIAFLTTGMIHGFDYAGVYIQKEVFKYLNQFVSVKLTPIRLINHTIQIFVNAILFIQKQINKSFTTFVNAILLITKQMIKSFTAFIKVVGQLSLRSIIKTLLFVVNAIFNISPKSIVHNVLAFVNVVFQPVKFINKTWSFVVNAIANIQKSLTHSPTFVVNAIAQLSKLNSKFLSFFTVIKALVQESSSHFISRQFVVNAITQLSKSNNKNLTFIGIAIAKVQKALTHSPTLFAVNVIAQYSKSITKSFISYVNAIVPLVAAGSVHFLSRQFTTSAQFSIQKMVGKFVTSFVNVIIQPIKSISKTILAIGQVIASFQFITTASHAGVYIQKQVNKFLTESVTAGFLSQFVHFGSNAGVYIQKQVNKFLAQSAATFGFTGGGGGGGSTGYSFVGFFFGGGGGGSTLVNYVTLGKKVFKNIQANTIASVFRVTKQITKSFISNVTAFVLSSALITTTSRAGVYIQKKVNKYLNQMAQTFNISSSGGGGSSTGYSFVGFFFGGGGSLTQTNFVYVTKQVLKNIQTSVSIITTIKRFIQYIQQFVVNLIFISNRYAQVQIPLMFSMKTIASAPSKMAELVRIAYVRIVNSFLVFLPQSIMAFVNAIVPTNQKNITKGFFLAVAMAIVPFVEAVELVVLIQKQVQFYASVIALSPANGLNAIVQFYANATISMSRFMKNTFNWLLSAVSLPTKAVNLVPFISSVTSTDTLSKQTDKNIRANVSFKLLTQRFISKIVTMFMQFSVSMQRNIGKLIIAFMYPTLLFSTIRSAFRTIIFGLRATFSETSNKSYLRSFVLTMRPIFLSNRYGLIEIPLQFVISTIANISRTIPVYRTAYVIGQLLYMATLNKLFVFKMKMTAFFSHILSEILTMYVTAGFKVSRQIGKNIRFNMLAFFVRISSMVHTIKFSMQPRMLSPFARLSKNIVAFIRVTTSFTWKFVTVRFVNFLFTIQTPVGFSRWIYNNTKAVANRFKQSLGIHGLGTTNINETSLPFKQDSNIHGLGTSTSDVVTPPFKSSGGVTGKSGD